MEDKRYRGYVLVKEQEPDTLISDPVSGGILLYQNFEEACTWSKKIANEMQEVIVVEPIDIIFLAHSLEKEEDDDETEEDPNDGFDDFKAPETIN